MTGSKTFHLRKLPKQERSRVMVSIIVQAAEQILERHGERGFNTNAIAERAGISIGSLYQYFPNKLAIATAISSPEAAGLAHPKELAA